MPAKKKTAKSSKTANKGKKGGMSKVMIGAAGVVAGAAIGGAAAAALANEKSRKKIQNAVGNFGHHTQDAVHEASQTVSEATDTATPSEGKPAMSASKK